MGCSDRIQGEFLHITYRVNAKTNFHLFIWHSLSCHICSGYFGAWCGLFFSVCAYRGAWRSWAEIHTARAAVTHLQVVNQRRLIKPCSPCYQLLIDFISLIWYAAPVRLSFSMISNCLVLFS